MAGEGEARPRRGGRSTSRSDASERLHRHHRVLGPQPPDDVRFASDGRVFVAENSGMMMVFDNLNDQTPTVVADLSNQVDDYWDRGLLGLALDPNFPAKPYSMCSTRWTRRRADGTDWNDGCPTPPGPTTDGCVATAGSCKSTLSDTMWVAEDAGHRPGASSSRATRSAIWASARRIAVRERRRGGELQLCGLRPGGGSRLTPSTRAATPPEGLAER